jgi:hypothetical protein
VDFPEPLRKDQVLKAITSRLSDKKTVKRISLIKGYKAGDLGFYFVELRPSGYFIVIADARFFIEDGEYGERSLVFFEYMLTYSKLFPHQYQSTLRLRCNSFLNKLLLRKTAQQLFWQTY